MRGLIILKDMHFVTSDRPTLATNGVEYRANLAQGGTVLVPRERVLAIEIYSPNQIETFRSRLTAIEKRYSA